MCLPVWQDADLLLGFLDLSKIVSGRCKASPSAFDVSILMATFNGSAFLREQLDSIFSQTHRNWKIYISDDGSNDATVQIIEEYIERYGKSKIRLYAGPQRGFAQNFLSLVKRQEISTDYYAFCDQDDIWFSDKLERALQAIVAVKGTGLPALYCSRTMLVSEHKKIIGMSPLFSRSPGFYNALVQSIAGANTMLFDESVRCLLAKIPEEADVVSHDWLAYQLTTGCGGKVIYDPQPTLYYRQHAENVIGANVTLSGKMSRIKRMMSGVFRGWNEKNIAVLRIFLDHFDCESKKMLLDFIQLRELRGIRRVMAFCRLGIKRQNKLDDVALLFAVIMNKL